VTLQDLILLEEGCNTWGVTFEPFFIAYVKLRRTDSYIGKFTGLHEEVMFVKRHVECEFAKGGVLRACLQGNST
jgi:hypothetical protein